MKTVKRCHNFNAGPSVLPIEVLERTKEDLMSYRGSGVGILEMSHRSSLFEELVDEVEKGLRSLMRIPDSYGIALCTGGATTQFSMVAMSFLGSKIGNYIIGGFWSERAFQEGTKFGKTHIAGSSKEEGYAHLPKKITISENAAYLHYTSNNTAEGTQYQIEPECGDIPLICDACSDILSKDIDITKYGVLYAGAQKNLGCAGVSVAIVKRALIDQMPQVLPVMQDYRTYLMNKSIYNTPPAFAIYILNEMLKWIREQGGVKAIEANSKKKAAILYEALDSNSKLLACAEKKDRSLMNITFRLTSSEEEKRFLKQATDRDIYGIQGHKAFGGIRVSIYNAIPHESVEVLADLMREF